MLRESELERYRPTVAWLESGLGKLEIIEIVVGKE